MIGTFEHVEDARLRMLVEHWLDAAGDDAMPARTAIDPAKLKPVLPIVWLCDYLPEAATLRYRLAGDEINSLYRRNLRGVEMHTIFPEGRKAAPFNRVLAVARDGVVLHARGNVYTSREISGRGERIVLPLAADGRTPDSLIGATALHWPREAHPPEVSRQEMTITMTPLADLRPRP